MNTILVLLIVSAIGVPILILSMILASKVFGGIDFGTLGSAAAKSFGLIFVANALSLIDGGVGWLLSLIVWIGGLMAIFKLAPLEAIVLSIINKIITFFIAGAILAAMR